MSLVLPESGASMHTPLAEPIRLGAPELFAEYSDAVFWIGKVAAHGTVFLPEAYKAVHRFRGDVYSKELGWVSPEALDEDGGEFDGYDVNSVQFAAVQNPDTVGSLRLIHKMDETHQYPIEYYFPEAFDRPADVNSAEVSRFIARRPDKLAQRMVSLSLIRAAAMHATIEVIPTYYCIIEKPLLNLLDKIGIPMEVMAAEKDIPEQGGVLYPIKIDAMAIIDSVRTSDPLLDAFFGSDTSNAGLGYFSESLMGGQL